MEQVKTNHSNSNQGFFDHIMLEKCLWIISLRTCSEAYAIILIITHIFEFIVTIIVTSLCYKTFMSYYSIEVTQRNREAPNVPPTSTEGEQASAEVGADPEITVRTTRYQSSLRRTSYLVNMASNNKKLTNPTIASMLAYNVMMTVVGVLTEAGISDKKAELFKICISVITFGNIIFFVVTVATAFDLCQRKNKGGASGNIVYFVIIFYGTWVLWSYSRDLERANE